MNKKIFIPIAIFIFLILGFGGYFLWLRIEESNLGFVSFEEFTQKKVNDEIIIEHRGTSFRAKIPEDYQLGWGVGMNSLIFVSNDFQPWEKVGPYSPPIPKKGCATEIEIKKEKEATDYDVLYTFTKNEINSCLKSPQECEDVVIEVDGYNALKHTFIPENQDVLQGKSISVQVPKDEKIYIFRTYLFFEDRERCAQEFEKFLKTISLR